MKKIIIDMHDSGSGSDSGSESNLKMNTCDTQIKKYKIKGIVNVRKSELNKLGYNDFKQWIENKDNVYIGRNMTHYVPGTIGSIWGNPFPVSDSLTLEESLEKYTQYIELNPNLIEKLKELDGKVLGCWCKPKKCHGDILVELVKKYNN
jgi:hypothetical protein